MPLQIVRDFREFAVKGNMVDMAVGIMIGGAFGTIVNSLVSDVLMPPLGVLTKGVDLAGLFLVLQDGPEVPGPYPTLAAAQEAGAATINYGLFINSLISFLIIAWVIFLFVRAMNKLRRASPDPAVSPAPAPGPEETLLAEIRDILKEK